METEQDPSPRGPAENRRPARPLSERVWAALVSPRLALALLAAVLACCVYGVTVVRGARAGELIFSTLWFNALLVLLAASSFAAFFSRIWRRRLTLLSVGMILFHLSFAAMLGGIAWNRLFFFDGLLRITEGETLPNGRIESYDRVDHGRLFDYTTLRGETTLVKLHVNYRAEGENKRAAYELVVDDGDASVHRIIWITQHLDFEGARFFCQKEGYSVLLVMTDRDGKELFGAHVPLQSYRQPDGSYQYGSGNSTETGPFQFPGPPHAPRAAIVLGYRPNAVEERKGDVTFALRPLGEGGGTGKDRSGTVAVGEPFDAGEFRITPREIRYWVSVNVRYDPGLTFILSSLCFGLAGMTATFVGRIRQSSRRQAAPPA